MRTSNRSKKTIGGALVAAGLVASVFAPATADAKPRGFVQDEFAVGLVYGTFNEDPNLTLLVGGSVEEFCPGDPGTAPMRVFFRADGTVDRKVNDRDQPIYLYEQNVGDSFDWIDAVCEKLDVDPDSDTVEPYAIGTAHLVVRESETPDGVVDVFNSVNGKLVASDHTNYRVRASADFILGPQGPEGDPADFVSFRLRKIGR
jgi:hypothetical protein